MKCKYLNMFLVALLAMTSLTSCLSDGDETIALENGNAKELLMRTGWRIKEWKGNPPSGLGWKIDDILKFENNGTFRKLPSDGKTHNWHWIVDPKGGDTTTGISIDDYEFGWKTWGAGFWVLYYPRTKPDNPSWIINLGDEPDVPDDPNTPKDPDESEEKECTNFVKRITVSRNEKVYDKYEFTYDTQGRITKLEYIPEISSHKETYLYTYSAESVKINSDYGSSIFVGKLNSQGYVCDAEYKDNYLKSFDNLEMNSTGDNWTYSLKNQWFYCKFMAKYKNDSNIDLNCFINGYRHTNSSKIKVLAPFGFLGTRAPFLLASIGEKYSDIDFSYHDYVLDDSLRVINVICDYVMKWDNRIENSDVITIEYYPKVRQPETDTQIHYK